MRAVGVAFNVYLSAKIGAAGMGLYSLIMSVYTFAVTFATSGINLAVTRVISEEIGKQNAAGVRRAMRACFIQSVLRRSRPVFSCFFSQSRSEPIASPIAARFPR